MSRAPPANPIAAATGFMATREAVGADGDDDDRIDLGLTTNQTRLLYLISLYTKTATITGEKEEWIRKYALLVLVYESIMKQVLDYDYAPCALMVHGSRTFFNYSQEGASDIDFLREEGLINSLRLCSNAYEPVLCYQISNRGADLAKRIGKTDREAVNSVVLAPSIQRELLNVLWRDQQWCLVGKEGYERVSTITETEVVSYVGSAYLPQCLRFGGRPTISNAHRAAECARASSTVRDVLDEIITLNSVSIVMAEFVPFGANHVSQVNANLGSADRVSGGYLSAMLDDDSGGTKFMVEPGLTSVSILDFSSNRYVNFEADIFLPHEPGIVQVETLGISVNADGTVFYGMQVEAIMDRIKDNVSLDQLSRLLVDVAIDSSTMMDSVLSPYQRKLVDLIYPGVSGNRDKFNLIVANEITPHLSAEEYMDKGEYENELRQVLGETRAAFDISEHDTLIFGSHGLLIAGPNARNHEPILCSYLQFVSMDLFIRNFFARTFLLNDNMKHLRHAINNYMEDPMAPMRIHDHLQILSDDVRMMTEILGYIVESLETCEIPAAPGDIAGKALYGRLQIADMAAQLSLRVLDLKKLMDGTKIELTHLKSLARGVIDSRQHKVQQESANLLQHIVQSNETSEKAQTTLKMIMMLLTGILAFHVLDRLTGHWTVMDSEWMQDFANPMIKNYPLVWLIVNLIFWLVVGYISIRILAVWTFATQGTSTVRIRVMQKLIMERFYTFLASKVTSIEDRGYDERNTIVRVSWEDPSIENKKRYGGVAPRITVEYDKVTGFLHFITIDYNRRLTKKKNMLSTLVLKNMVSDDFVEAGIFVDRAFNFREDPKSEEAAAAGSKLQAGVRRTAKQKRLEQVRVQGAPAAASPTAQSRRK